MVLPPKVAVRVREIIHTESAQFNQKILAGGNADRAAGLLTQALGWRRRFSTKTLERQMQRHQTESRLNYYGWFAAYLTAAYFTNRQAAEQLITHLFLFIAFLRAQYAQHRIRREKTFWDIDKEISADLSRLRFAVSNLCEPQVKRELAASVVRQAQEIYDLLQEEKTEETDKVLYG
jgi:hypothetical protein